MSSSTPPVTIRDQASIPSVAYKFFGQFARIVNAGQSRSIVLSGNIYDLYFDGTQYVPIVPFLTAKTKVAGLIQVLYELNGPIRIADEDRAKLRNAWAAWKIGVKPDQLPVKDITGDASQIELRRREFDQYLRDAMGNATQALEFLRQLTICSRSVLPENLLIIIEGADMLLPAGDGDVSRLNDTQQRRIAIVTDWFGDPGFFTGRDTVCLIAESRSLIHPRISRLPQVLSVEIPAPDREIRQHFVQFTESASGKQILNGNESGWLASATAGLSLHALRQLLVGAGYSGQGIQKQDVFAQVEQFIQAQLGEDVIEFKKPEHSLEQVMGFRKLKEFLKD
jgi:hypothetical protein